MWHTVPGDSASSHGAKRSCQNSCYADSVGTALQRMRLLGGSCFLFFSPFMGDLSLCFHLQGEGFAAELCSSVQVGIKHSLRQKI